MTYYIVLYCIVLYCIVLYCIVSSFIIRYSWQSATIYSMGI